MSSETSPLTPQTAYKSDPKPVSLLNITMDYVRNPALVREMLFCICWCYFGWYSSQIIYLPLLGGVNERPIPYQQTKSGDIILDLGLTNPVGTTTFPSHLLKLLALWMPMAILLLIPLLSPKTKHCDTHSAMCTLLFAIGLSEFAVQFLKLYIGRLRPNFYAVCGFDVETLACTSSEDYQREGRMSFPSGHSSLSFTSMMVLTLYFLGRLGYSNWHSANGDSRGPCGSGLGKVLYMACLSPLVLASWIAASRIVDNWHHPSDVIAGTLFGIICALISYHLWYPHIFSQRAGVPLHNTSSSFTRVENEKEKDEECIPMYQN